MADEDSEDKEKVAWEKSTKSRSQKKKFREKQEARLTEWSTNLVDQLNKRFLGYGIPDLKAELEPDSRGEKINVHFPRKTTGSSDYQLAYVLLEFGGRNRGRPTVNHSIECYLAEIPEFSQITCPSAVVQAYHPEYILWEKLTALHQFSTMENEPKKNRLARHWYDVDCLLRKKIADPLNSHKAMKDVVSMKDQRWAEKGVDYKTVLEGNIQLIPSSDRLAEIALDHKAAVKGGMFYGQPDKFDEIIRRIGETQDHLNSTFKKTDY